MADFVSFSAADVLLQHARGAALHAHVRVLASRSSEFEIIKTEQRGGLVLSITQIYLH